MPLCAGHGTTNQEDCAPVKERICKHIAGQLAGLSDSPVWVQHLQRVSPGPEGCPPGHVLHSPADTVKEEQPGVCNRHPEMTSVSLCKQGSSQAKLQGGAMISQAQACCAVPTVTPIEFGAIAPEAVHKAACACVHHPAAQAISSAAARASSRPDDVVKLGQDKVAGVSQQVRAAESHVRPLDAPLPLSEQLTAQVLNLKCKGTEGVSATAKRQHSSIKHVHQHHLRERPAGSYSLPIVGVSDPPYAASSQGRHSVQRAANRFRCEGSTTADTDSLIAVRR